jgi:hypothetical protein
VTRLTERELDTTRGYAIGRRASLTGHRSPVAGQPPVAVFCCEGFVTGFCCDGLMLRYPTV